MKKTIPAYLVLLLLSACTAGLRADAATLRYCRITHYCGGCDATHRTATGARWRSRGVAVDTRVIPAGSKVWISGYGDRPFIADDTGGRVSGSHVDVRHLSNDCTCTRKGTQLRRVVFVRPARKAGRRHGK